MLYEMPHQEWQQLQPLRPLPGFQMLVRELQLNYQELLESLPLLRDSPRGNQMSQAQGAAQVLKQLLLVLETPPPEDVVEENVDTKPRHNGAL